MEIYRRQLETCDNNTDDGPRPVLKEFVPLSNMSISYGEKSATLASAEKANWMVSAQLWSPAATMEPTNTKLAFDTKQHNCGRGSGGAFLPFSKDKSPRALPELALAPSAEEAVAEEKKCEVRSSGGVGEGKGGSNGNEGQQPTAAAGGQSAHRKARRCWSPDLHRQFVNALQMLGGSQGTWSYHHLVRIELNLL